MTSPQCEMNSLSIIRALISARGRNGATLQEIKEDYREQVGNELNKGDNFALRKWIQQIAEIEMKCRNGSIVYFLNPPAQSRLFKLNHFTKQRLRTPKHSRRNLNMLSQSNQSSAFSTPKSCMKTRVFHNKKIYDGKSFDINESVSEVMNQPRQSDIIMYQSPVLQTPSKSRKRPRSIASTSNDQLSTKKSRSASRDPIQEDHSVPDFNNNLSSCHNYKLFSPTDRLSKVNEHTDPFMPEFHKCPLVGDNFFLSIAKIELGFGMTKRDRLIQSGYCVSGQTIAQATMQIENMNSNQVILINIGSCDIANGKELVDLIFDMMRLMRTCLMKDIKPILTTILPLANFRLGNRVAVTNGFNEFLIKNVFNFPVIQLHTLFTENDGVLNANCYHQTIRYVSGMQRPLVFWNRRGRKRVMKTLTQELGAAILKMLTSER